MYCKYCGKPLSDGARFCAFCGRDQSENGNPAPTSTVSNRNPRAIICTIIAIIINPLIVVFSLTDIFKITVGNDYLSSSFSLGILDLFDNAKIIKYFSMGSESLEQVSSSLITFGVILIISLVLLVIYYLYYIFSYSFTKQDQFVSIFGKNYNNYSTISELLFIVVTVIGMAVFSNNLGEYGNITPSVTMIMIYVLCGVQLIVNKLYLFIEYQV